MKLADIQNGVVCNVIVVNPKAVPDWAASWPEIPDAFGTGDLFENGAFAPAPVDLIALAASVRERRDAILATEVDPIASNTLRWNALTQEQQAALAAYRQALLDVPQQEGFPQEVVWPEGLAW